MIDFYYAPTPNGWKVAIMLEECGIDYQVKRLYIENGDQFADEYLVISPNAKMPAIVDHDNPDAPVSVFESGAILLYLAEKTGRFMPSDELGRKEMMEWLFWQVGNQGPMAGQLSHFVNYAPDGEDYGRERYKGEYERNLAVLDKRLNGSDYILGEYSIADMISFPWAFIAKALDTSLDEFPNVAAWRGRIKQRPAVIRAINLYKDEQFIEDENAENNPTLFNQGAEHLRGET
ncbi:MAG: glutathione S-transferase N-terminal domain-containing protein [Pseudomonadota bacterium]